MIENLKQKTGVFLNDVSGEFVFRSHSGRVLNNMKGLADELGAMTPEDYAFHVNAEKNDFMNWVRDVIRDNTLARSLQKASGQAQAARLVNRRIALLTGKA